ncbi:MAG TPA: hypothetical protein VIX83_12410 [Candidatus Cybelea sp.]
MSALPARMYGSAGCAPEAQPASTRNEITAKERGIMRRDSANRSTPPAQRRLFTRGACARRSQPKIKRRHDDPVVKEPKHPAAQSGRHPAFVGLQQREVKEPPAHRRAEAAALLERPSAALDQLAGCLFVERMRLDDPQHGCVVQLQKVEQGAIGEVVVAVAVTVHQVLPAGAALREAASLLNEPRQPDEPGKLVPSATGHPHRQ